MKKIRKLYEERSFKAGSKLLERLGLKTEAYNSTIGDEPAEENVREESTVLVPKQLAEPLHHWHYGQGDPVYQVGSMAYAEQPVAESLVQDAIDELESLRTDAQESGGDQEELVQLIDELTQILQGENNEPNF